MKVINIKSLAPGSRFRFNSAASGFKTFLKYEAPVLQFINEDGKSDHIENIHESCNVVVFDNFHAHERSTQTISKSRLRDPSESTLEGITANGTE